MVEWLSRKLEEREEDNDVEIERAFSQGHPQGNMLLKYECLLRIWKWIDCLEDL